MAINRESLEALRSALTEATDERYEQMQEWYKDADKSKREGDMYGWNFFQGMAGGANWVDIYYGRVKRALDELLKENPQ